MCVCYPIVVMNLLWKLSSEYRQSKQLLPTPVAGVSFNAEEAGGARNGGLEIGNAPMLWGTTDLSLVIETQMGENGKEHVVSGNMTPNDRAHHCRRSAAA